MNGSIERAHSCHFPPCFCHSRALFGVSETFWRTSIPDTSGCSQLEPAETQQHVRRLVIFWLKTEKQQLEKATRERFDMSCSVSRFKRLYFVLQCVCVYLQYLVWSLGEIVAPPFCWPVIQFLQYIHGLALWI